jgi:hypothetical protein
MKDLERENIRLERLVADLSLEKQALNGPISTASSLKSVGRIEGSPLSPIIANWLEYSSPRSGANLNRSNPYFSFPTVLGLTSCFGPAQFRVA